MRRNGIKTRFEQINEWTNGWMDGQMNEWINEREEWSGGIDHDQGLEGRGGSV